MKKTTQKEMHNKFVQALGKVLYINSFGVTCDANFAKNADHIKLKYK